MKEGLLIEEAYKLKHLPITIIQGRYDVVCPVKSSWDLYNALGGKENKNVEYIILGEAGHSAHESSIKEALVQAANDYKKLVK